MCGGGGGGGSRFASSNMQYLLYVNVTIFQWATHIGVLDLSQCRALNLGNAHFSCHILILECAPNGLTIFLDV